LFFALYSGECFSTPANKTIFFPLMSRLAAAAVAAFRSADAYSFGSFFCFVLFVCFLEGSGETVENLPVIVSRETCAKRQLVYIFKTTVNDCCLSLSLSFSLSLSLLQLLITHRGSFLVSHSGAFVNLPPPPSPSPSCTSSRSDMNGGSPETLSITAAATPGHGQHTGHTHHAGRTHRAGHAHCASPRPPFTLATVYSLHRPANRFRINALNDLNSSINIHKKRECNII